MYPLCIKTKYPIPWLNEEGSFSACFQRVHPTVDWSSAFQDTLVLEACSRRASSPRGGQKKQKTIPILV